MADETIIQTPPQEPDKSRSEERFTQLSDKVKTEAEGREKAEKAAAEATRERDFYQGFSDVVADNPAAKEHKEDILSKVKSGYTVEDATYAVLGKAGKLGNQPASQQIQNPAGGSATTVTPQAGSKAVGEMTQAERREELSKELIWS